MSEVWHLSGSIMSHTAKEILASLITDDKKNYDKSEQEFSTEISLLDDSLRLYIKAIQGAYSVEKEWENKPTFEAPVILFSSVLNILLLIRHAVLLGYFPETPTLFRNCHERITRGYLFWQDESEANRFLSGKIRSQEQIDDRLSALLERRGKEERETYAVLRKHYKHQSEMSHPNLTSFKSRYGDLETVKLKERTLNSPIWGGFLSNDLVKPVVYSALQITLQAISIIRLIFVDSSGSYEADYKAIFRKYEDYIESVKPKT